MKNFMRVYVNKWFQEGRPIMKEITQPGICHKIKEVKGSPLAEKYVK